METIETKQKGPKGIGDFFKEQQALYEEIYKIGFSEYTKNIGQIEKAFGPHDHCLRCMDEGTPGGLHSAGSGILWKDQKALVEALKEAGVKEITSHDGCGAARIYCQENNLDLTKSDEIGKEYAENLAKKMGVPHRHISFSGKTSASEKSTINEEMQRPDGLHIARVAYYDGIGGFNFSKLKELPPGFIISRAINTDKISMGEAGVAIDIATGGHSYGNLIDKNHPFVLVAIGKDKEHMFSLMYELRKIQMSAGDRVLVDGFIAPAQEK
ncbi:MAG: hypothetical protein WC609_02075 [Candidatus Paceibacterota bacterium]|jgi:hypothetical protein